MRNLKTSLLAVPLAALVPFAVLAEGPIEYGASDAALTAAQEQAEPRVRQPVDFALTAIGEIYPVPDQVTEVRDRAEVRGETLKALRDGKTMRGEVGVTALG